jgi:sirohydrochlorin cobaltochelatase
MTLVLVGGHESVAGRQLDPWVDSGHAFRAVGAGRALTEAVEAALAHTDRPVCVVPMTLGRDPDLVADAARSLRWLARSTAPGRLALTEPFGSAEHLVGWLRAAAGRSGPAGAEAGSGAGTALLVTAPAADSFQDAELFRIARLVQRHGRHRWVEVAFTGPGADPGLAEGVDRCRRLGAERVVLLPAAFGPASAAPVPGAEDGGRLLSLRAVAGVLDARADAALHRLRHGRDGIAAGLDAGHGTGFAHTHGPGHSHSHDDHHHDHDRQLHASSH